VILLLTELSISSTGPTHIQQPDSPNLSPDFPPCLIPTNNTSLSYTVVRSHPLSITVPVLQKNGTTTDIWLMGNSSLYCLTVPMNKKGEMAIDLGGLQTNLMEPGTYVIKILNPMDITGKNISCSYERQIRNQSDGSFVVVYNNSQTYSVHVRSILSILNNSSTLSPEVTILIEDPRIRILPIGNTSVGAIVNINGTTNLPVGSDIEFRIWLNEPLPGIRWPPECGENHPFMDINGSWPTTKVFKEDNSDTNSIVYRVNTTECPQGRYWGYGDNLGSQSVMGPLTFFLTPAHDSPEEK
jgi:hypothetical protein